MGIVFGLLTSLSIGLSDLFGRRVVHRQGPLTAGVTMHLVAIATSAVVVLVGTDQLLASDAVVGLLSGVGFGAGLGCYLAGLNRASSAVVAPPVATLSAVIPLTYSVLRGAAPSVVAWVGAAVCIAGIGLITAGGGPSESLAVGLRWGLASGLGYGFGLSVILEASDDGGSWPAVFQRITAFGLLAAAAGANGAALWPRPTLRLWALAAGIMAGMSTVFYLLGAAVDEPSTVVTASLFPAMSVLVGRSVYGDSVRPPQAVGVAVVILGVIAIAAG